MFKRQKFAVAGVVTKAAAKAAEKIIINGCILNKKICN